MFKYIGKMNLPTCETNSELKTGEIRKTILLSGTILPDYKDGSKVLFHFNTRKCDDLQCVIDDTRNFDRPMEFILGKKFKLEVWETCIKTMKLKEIAEFTVEKSLVTSYPTVSKMVRSAFGSKNNKHEKHRAAEASANPHCCGMMALQKEKMLDPELDELVQKPQSLKFKFELLEVINPGEYEKDSWEMTDEEKIASLPKLREEGNQLYNAKKYEEASQKYAEALGRLEQLALKEKPKEEEWLHFEEMKIPFLLNYSQCMLLNKDFYSVIEHTTTVLQRDPENIKALFRRAQAHVGAWNTVAAKSDYNQIKSVDPTKAALVNKELQKLDTLIKCKNNEDKAKLAGKLF